MSSENTSSFPPVIITILSLCCVVGAVYFGSPSVKTLYKMSLSKGWPQIQGQIVSAEVERRWASKGDELGQEYIPRVWFSYYINDKNYVSDNAVFGRDGTFILREAETLVSRFPQGAKVPVFYDPSDHSFAVLDRELVPIGDCVRVGLFLLIFLSSLIAFLSGLFRGKTE